MIRNYTFIITNYITQQGSLNQLYELTVMKFPAILHYEKLMNFLK